MRYEQERIIGGQVNGNLQKGQEIFAFSAGAALGRSGIQGRAADLPCQDGCFFREYFLRASV
jgi:hypothetical protein